MAKNTIPNNHDGFEVCILMCKHAKDCGPTVFDCECTCDEECVKFNKFDIPEKDKHTEQYIREQTIREVVPIVMEFFNDLCFTNEGTVFYHSDEDREECMKDVLAKVYEELKRKNLKRTTIERMLAVIKKIAQTKQEVNKASNQIAAYEIGQQMGKLIDELVSLYAEMEQK